MTLANIYQYLEFPYIQHVIKSPREPMWWVLVPGPVSHEELSRTFLPDTLPVRSRTWLQTSVRLTLTTTLGLPYSNPVQELPWEEVMGKRKEHV